MGGGILQALAFVGGGCQDFFSTGEHSPDRHFTLLGGFFGGPKGEAHHGKVVCVVRFKFFGHGVDNNRVKQHRMV